MRLALALCLLTTPALAEDNAPVPDGEGFSLMEEGAKLLLRGLMSEMEPTLNDMQNALKDMEPALRDLGPKFQQLIAMIDDFKNYDAPEMMPNGDIIIRRNAPMLPKPDFLPGPNGETDL